LLSLQFKYISGLQKSQRGSKYRVKSIYFYPIKSCCGIELKKAQICVYGIENDRKWMLISSKDNNCISQKQIPKMSLITPSLSNGILFVDFPGMETLKITPAKPTLKNECEVKLKSSCKAIDEGDDCANWFQRALQTDSIRLVRMPEIPNRKVIEEYQDESLLNLVSFTGFPFLIISEASLNELNNRISASEPLSMRRFRPNVVVDGDYPFIEDSWNKIQIGNVTIRCVRKCSRCKMTTIDPDSGEMTNNEPLDTLATFRKGLHGKGGSEVCFGQQAIHENTGEIEIGQMIQILKSESN